MRSDEAGEEQRCVPPSVARMLLRSYCDDDTRPRSRCEALQIVVRVSSHMARQRIAQLEQRRDHSCHEVRSRLTQEGFGQPQIEEALQAAVACGLVSDERFAQSFIRSKMRSGWGMQRIEHELSLRGVDAHDVAGWPYEYADPQDEYARALDVASRKRVSEPHAYAKLARFLVGRGFSYDVSARAAKQALHSYGPAPRKHT